MQITDKLIRQISETKYLSTDNTDRYRTILRYFYIQYERMQYWLYQEDIYEQMHQFEYFKDYTMEQCQQDLETLRLWKNLITIQDTRKVSSIEEFKNKKFQYQLSEYTVQIERMVLKLENLEIEGASLEPTLLERIKNSLFAISKMHEKSDEDIYGWWRNLNEDFIRLNHNYQDYIRELNSIKAEEMMKTQEFLIFKDHLVDYLRNFIKNFQDNISMIEACISRVDMSYMENILSRAVIYEKSIPHLETYAEEDALLDTEKGRWQSIKQWFVSTSSHLAQAEQLLDTTNDIIRKITRYAAQISEQSNMRSNRKEEYKKIAQMFLECEEVEDAHKLSALVFGVEQFVHLKGDFIRQSNSRNSGVYEEEPLEVTIAPRIRNYREKANRSIMLDRTKEKQHFYEETLKQMQENREQIDKLQTDGVIDFEQLPVITPEIREVLLGWISAALEDKDWKGKTQQGEEYQIEVPDFSMRCTVTCTDGVFIMPKMKLLFKGLA